VGSSGREKTFFLGFRWLHRLTRYGTYFLRWRQRANGVRGHFGGATMLNTSFHSGDCAIPPRKANLRGGNRKWRRPALLTSSPDPGSLVGSGPKRKANDCARYHPSSIWNYTDPSGQAFALMWTRIFGFTDAAGPQYLVDNCDLVKEGGFFV